MKQRNLGLAVLLSMVSVAAYAADMPAPGKATVGGMKIHGLVDTYYQFNFNRPELVPQGSTSGNVASGATNPAVNYRAYDRQHRQFDINQATVGLSYDANPVGFDVRIGMGTQLETLNAVPANADKGAADRTVTNGSTFEHIRKASVTWKPSKFSLTAGRYDADFGVERIDSVDNWNYGRSFQFTYMQPKFFTGVLLGYDFGSGLVAKLGYANGVDRYMDNNKSGSYTGQVAYETGANTFGLSYTASPERFDISKEFKHYVTLFAKHNYSDTFALAGEFSYNRGRNDTTGVNTNGTTRRETSDIWAASLSGHLSLLADHWETLRVEYLHDADGFITQRASSASMVGTTFTHRYMVSKNMSIWGEARWDWSNRNIFMNQGRVANQRDNQVTLTAAATFNI